MIGFCLNFLKLGSSTRTGKDWQGYTNSHQKFYAKLANRYYGPFQILQAINPTSFRLKLPEHWHIHNAFHVSLLRPYVGPPPDTPVLEDPPEVDETKEIFHPEQIIHHSEQVR